MNELRQKGYDEGAIWNFRIVANDVIRMANLAIFVGRAVKWCCSAPYRNFKEA